MRKWTIRAAYQDADRGRWAEVLQSEKTASGYQKLNKLLSLLDQNEDAGEPMEATISNVTSMILPGNIGYLKISSFSGDMETDGAAIADFYAQCANCNDLILDLTTNSGILVQFTALFGLNADGSSNEKTGTTPDIVSTDGEKPLVTALRAISAQKGVEP